MLIRRETLRAVQPATTTEDSRYFLNAIRIEPDGSCVATNGHVLIKASEPRPMPAEDYPQVPGLPTELHAPTAPILLDADKAERLCKGTPRKSYIDVLKTISVMSNGDGSSYAVATDLSVPVIVTLKADGDEHTFPAYDRVIPKEQTTVALCLGVPVLEALLKSAKAIGATGINFAVPTAKPEVTGAITVTYRSDDVTVLAVAMPIRL